MIIYTANSTGKLMEALVARFPSRLGFMCSPGGQQAFPHHHFALDNGRYSSWSRKKRWSKREYMKLIEWALRQRIAPDWILVPDVVADRDATLREWERWLPELEHLNWPLAFAAQDGMMAGDIPAEAAIVFLGGTYEWKWAHLNCWQGRELHVGRVNWLSKLEAAERAGAVSVDGTGWFRGDQNATLGLIAYLARGGVSRDRHEAFFGAALDAFDNLRRWEKRRVKQLSAPLFDGVLYE